MSSGEGGAFAHRLVVGVGGVGKTTVLNEWCGDTGAPRVTARFGRPTSADQVNRAVDLASGLVVVDDLQWLDDDAVEALLGRCDDLAIWASARPHPQSVLLLELLDRMTEAAPPERIGFLTLDQTGVRLAQLTGRPANAQLVDVVYEWSGGSPALIADLAAFGDLALLGEEGAPVPFELIEAVSSRLRRSGAAATPLAQLLAYEPGLSIEVAVGALDTPASGAIAERTLRASGLVGPTGELLPVVAAAVSADLTVDDRRRLAARVVGSLSDADPVAAARHLGGAEATQPSLVLSAAVQLCDAEPAEANRLLDQIPLDGLDDGDLRTLALLALRLGRPDFHEIVDRGLVERPAEFDDLGVIRELRFLRWPLAAERSTTTPAADGLVRLARVLVGQPVSPSHEETLVNGLSDAIETVIGGESSSGFARLAGLADNFGDSDRLTRGIGVTPHLLGALVGLFVGDHEGAASLLDEAVDRDVGGAPERDANAATAAFARLRLGDYAPAVELVRTSPAQNDFRLRLLFASLQAGLARRSGDTARMRLAWQEADSVLTRPTVSWLLVDLLAELLLVGAKLGNDRRVDEVVAELERQVASHPEHGAVVVSVDWLRFQLAVQRNDRTAVKTEAALLGAKQPADRRSLARVASASLWSLAIDGVGDVDELLAGAMELANCGDSWEGSRLLGHAALDHPDASAARRLLDAARGLSVDLADAESGDGLMALGLSEREAEVAQLVASGKTYKEIGAQLYISPKTVEHHVARSRQKLGAASRAEFLAAVRDAGPGPAV